MAWYRLLGGHIHYEGHSLDTSAGLDFLGTMGTIRDVRTSLYGLKTKREDTSTVGEKFI